MLINAANPDFKAAPIQYHSRRKLLKAFGLSGLFLDTSRLGRAQSQELDRTITEGFVVLGAQHYDQWQRVPSPYGQGGWADVRNAYIGVIQQLRLNWSFDSFCNYAFASRAVPSAYDIGQLANTMIQRGFAPSVQNELQMLVTGTIGQENATWQQIQERGYDDMHSGNASLFQYFESLNPSGCPPLPAEACNADQAYCYDEPFLSDPYNPSQDPDTYYPWFNQELPFVDNPKSGITMEEICFYTKWGLRYLTIVVRVLISSGGALAAPEIAAPIGTTVLLLNFAQWIACG